MVGREPSRGRARDKVREVGSEGWNTDHVMPYGLL